MNKSNTKLELHIQRCSVKQKLKNSVCERD